MQSLAVLTASLLLAEYGSGRIRPSAITPGCFDESLVSLTSLSDAGRRRPEEERPARAVRRVVWTWLQIGWGRRPQGAVAGHCRTGISRNG